MPGRSRRTGPVRIRALSLLAVGLAFVGVIALFVGVFPTRAMVDQRRDTADVSSELSALEADNAALQQRIDELGTEAEIEREARREYGLVKPGEEAYAVLPDDGAAYPGIWPFTAAPR